MVESYPVGNIKKTGFIEFPGLYKFKSMTNECRKQQGFAECPGHPASCNYWCNKIRHCYFHIIVKPTWHLCANASICHKGYFFARKIFKEKNYCRHSRNFAAACRSFFMAICFFSSIGSGPCKSSLYIPALMILLNISGIKNLLRRNSPPPQKPAP